MLRHCLRHVLSLHPDSEAQHEVSKSPQSHKDADQATNIHPEHVGVHGELLQKLRGVLEMAVGYGAVQLLPIEAVNGKNAAFEAIADVSHVRQPLQHRRNVVQRDEETWGVREESMK